MSNSSPHGAIRPDEIVIVTLHGLNHYQVGPTVLGLRHVLGIFRAHAPTVWLRVADVDRRRLLTYELVTKSHTGKRLTCLTLSSHSAYNLPDIIAGIFEKTSSCQVNDVPCVLIAVILIGSLAVIGCDTNETESNEIVEISMEPQNATLEAGETADFSIVALTASGETVEAADHDVRWWSTDTTVFKVTNDGNVTAQGEGEAYCVAEMTPLSKAASALFVGRDSAFVTVLK